MVLNTSTFNDLIILIAILIPVLELNGWVSLWELGTWNRNPEKLHSEYWDDKLMNRKQQRQTLSWKPISYTVMYICNRTLLKLEVRTWNPDIQCSDHFRNPSVQCGLLECPQNWKIEFFLYLGVWTCISSILWFSKQAN